MPGLGRHYAPDPRDARYPMRLLLKPDISLPDYHYFQLGKHLPLDQGETGTCTTHAWGGFLFAAPIMDKTIENPYDVYRKIVLTDEFSDNDDEATKPDSELQYGSSVRAVAQYHRSKGLISNFVWASSAEEVGLWILQNKAPVVVGTNWYYDMFDLQEGFAVPGGGVAGGHAWLVYGYNRKAGIFRGLTSWGPGFGDRSRFWMHRDDLQRLLLEDGEACAAVEQKVTPLPK